jgi:3alpha(or 20beta)-hydroxysteroid dehydrogenase
MPSTARSPLAEDAMLQGRVVVVTGAAQGLGAAIAIAAADAGAEVVGVDLAPTAPDERVTMRWLDVTDERGWRDLASWLRDMHGACHGLVNNAGITMRHRLGEVSLSDWNRTLAINVTGPMLGMQALMGLMPPGSSIVNVASIAALTGHFAVPYTASKWALRGLSRAASLELGPREIRVNAVMPGLIATAMTADVPQIVSEALVGSVPLGRPATPADVASVVRFLLGPESAYLSGVEIAVDGGQTAHGGMKLLSDAVRSAADDRS